MLKAPRFAGRSKARLGVLAKASTTTTSLNNPDVPIQEAMEVQNQEVPDVSADGMWRLVAMVYTV